MIVEVVFRYVEGALHNATQPRRVKRPVQDHMLGWHQGQDPQARFLTAIPREAGRVKQKIGVERVEH